MISSAQKLIDHTISGDLNLNIGKSLDTIFESCSFASFLAMLKKSGVPGDGAKSMTVWQGMAKVQPGGQTVGSLSETNNLPLENRPKLLTRK